MLILNTVLLYLKDKLSRTDSVLRMKVVLVGTFLFIMGLVGINLFIALMSYVVEEVNEESRNNAVLQRVSIHKNPLKTEKQT